MNNIHRFINAHSLDNRQKTKRIYRLIWTSLVCGAAIISPVANAQELLELPEFRRPSQNNNHQEVLQLELLTEDELRQLQTQFPAPPQAESAPAPASTPEAPLIISEENPPATLPEPLKPTAVILETDEEATTETQTETSEPIVESGSTETLEAQPSSTSELSAYPEIKDLVELLKEGDPESPKTDQIANLLSENYLKQLQSSLGTWGNFSLMHKESDIDLLLIAIAEYRKRESMPEPVYEADPDTLTANNSAEDLPPEPIKQLQYPIIYLGTIMYASPERWSVWVNGVKYTAHNNEALDGIVIEHVSMNDVHLRWIPVIEIDGFEANTKKIKYKEGGFHITMQSNQALLARKLLVQEGRVYSEGVYEALNPPEAEPDAKTTSDGTTATGDSKKKKSKNRRKVRADEDDRINMNRVINLYQESQETIKEKQ